MKPLIITHESESFKLMSFEYKARLRENLHLNFLYPPQE